MNQDWVEKDFYAILGVPRTADQAEIKRAYRKLAQKHHPDANPGDSQAEDKFKKVAEAYSILSDVTQRKEYDELRRLVDSGAYAGQGRGGPGFGGQGFGAQGFRVEDLSDLFGGGLGDFRGRRGRGPQRGADTAAELHISFEDAVRGVTTQVQVRGEAACSRCGGSGAEPGTTSQTCPTCRGQGQVAQSQGLFAFPQTCQQCRGTGRLIESPCTNCRGAGRETTTRTINLRIPAGVKAGATIKLRGKGAPGTNGGPAGDLLVTVHVARHQIFGRSADDLTLTVPVTYTEATLGTKLSVPTLDAPVTLKIPSGTPSGKVFRVRGRGVKPEKRREGDLLVKIEVAVPSRLGKDEKRLLEQLADLETGDIRSHLET